MTIKTKVFLTIIDVLMAATLFIPAKAFADTPGVVTLSEFNTAQIGWSMNKVEDLFDTTGTRMPSWDTCDPDGTCYRWKTYEGTTFTVLTDYRKGPGQTAWHLNFKDIT